LKTVQDLWKEQMDRLMEQNRLSKDKNSAKRIHDLEEEIAKIHTEFTEKERTLNDQLTMWKEKTKIKQMNYVKQEEEFQKEMASQKEKFTAEMEKKVDTRVSRCLLF
jgi:hypothetical protein